MLDDFCKSRTGTDKLKKRMRCKISPSMDYGWKMTAFGEQLSDREMEILNGRGREREKVDDND